MIATELFGRLASQFGEDILQADTEALDAYVVVNPKAIRDISLFLRDAEGMRFDNLCMLTATDYPPDRIQVVYHLWSFVHHHLIVVKTDIPRDQAELASVADIWPAANWHEREAYDLVGVKFSGHPDLRRLLLPEDWEGHPLRKDWSEATEYHGIPTTRTFSNQLFAKLDETVIKSQPTQALLVYDDSGKGAKEAGEKLASRLAVADIRVKIQSVSEADAASLLSYDMLIFGANSSGLLFAAPSSKMASFIDLLPNLDSKPCVIYVVYTAHPGHALRELDAKVSAKRGQVLARGATQRSRADKDPDNLAAIIVEMVRNGTLARRPQAANAEETTAVHSSAASTTSRTDAKEATAG